MKINYKTKRREKPDKGDWVIVLEEDMNYDNCEKGMAQLITKSPYKSSGTNKNDYWYIVKFSGGGQNGYNKIRFATPEEIEIAKKLYKQKGTSYEDKL